MCNNYIHLPHFQVNKEYRFFRLKTTSNYFPFWLDVLYVHHIWQVNSRLHVLCFHSDINVEYSSVVFSPHLGRGSSWDCLCILVMSLSDLRLCQRWWQVKPMRLAVYFLLAFTNVTCWCDNWKEARLSGAKLSGDSPYSNLFYLHLYHQ